MSAWLNEAVCSALAAGGLRERRQRPQRQQHKLPRHLSQEFGIRQLRRAVRQARKGSDAAQQAGLRQELKRAARKAHRAAARLRGEAHEALMQSDPSAFFRPFNRAAKTLCSIEPDTLVRHFCSLLGGDQPPEEPPPPEPPPTPRPPPEPPPTGGEAATAAAAHASERAGRTPSQPQPAAGSAQPAASAGSRGSSPGSSPSASQRQEQQQLASLKARMHAPFTAAEVAAHSRRLRNRKAVAGSLPPWFLKAATAQLAPALAAVFNAWVRVGQLSAADALSLITAIPKAGAAADSCDGLRGIAVGTLPAKLFACMMERRISDWAEASGSRATGQFGFRRRRSTAQAALVLRSLQDRHRSRGQQLWAAWVDFRKAYDSIPRRRLWAKLAARGLGGNWLRGVQALYADVPMSVCTANGPSPCFQARIGLKQGCPLSPTLFGLYIDDFEAEVMAAAQRGEQLDLPSLGSGGPMPPLLYADDMALLATSAAGLQRQLDLLQDYCQRWGLTVNTVKTKVQLLSGERTQAAAQQTAERAGLQFGGQRLEVVTTFKYLGITFHSTTCLAGAAVAARAKAARAALHSCRARCAALGIESAPVQLQLFSTMVDSVLSYGAEVWGPQLVAKAAGGCGSAGCAAEKLHLSFLRHLLGVRQGTPNAVVLAETGQRPLWMRWLLRAARLWNRALAEPPDSLVRQAVAASAAQAAEPGSRGPARQPWAQQLAAGLAAVGIELDLADPRPVSRAAVRNGCQQRQLEQLVAAAERSGATKLRHYVNGVRGGVLEADSLSQAAAYLSGVRERSRRQALAQWRTGSFWGLEETGRWQRLPREQRLCPHCQGDIETVEHMIFHCPLYGSLRLRFSDLFDSCPPSLHAFFEQPAPRLASFAAACRRQWLEATAALPALSIPCT